jgi:hypothetical protein
MGERTAEFRKGYGSCQCGCGGWVDTTDSPGLFMRFIQDDDAVAAGRRDGPEDAARLVEMFSDQIHAWQKLQVKLGILEPLNYLRVFCCEQQAMGDALIARPEAALRGVRQGVG